MSDSPKSGTSLVWEFDWTSEKAKEVKTWCTGSKFKAQKLASPASQDFFLQTPKCPNALSNEGLRGGSKRGYSIVRDIEQLEEHSYTISRL